MTIYTGTDQDDIFDILGNPIGSPNAINADDEFHGGLGEDTIHLIAQSGTFSTFSLTQNVVFTSIENILFDVPTSGAIAVAGFDIVNNPFVLFDATLTGSGGIHNVIFQVGIEGGDFTVPDIELINWQDQNPRNLVGLSAPSSTNPTGNAVTLRANDNLASAQSLLGGNGDDTLIGHSGLDFLTGGVGDDRLFGGGGDDVIRFVATSGIIDNSDQSGDVADGELGEDVLSVQTSGIAPVLISVEHIQFFADFQFGQGHSIQFQTSLHADYIANVNVVGIESGFVEIVLDDRDNFDASSVTFNDQIFNGSLVASDNETSFEITGNSNANILIGTERGDTLRGKDGNDSLFGGGGDDLLYGGFGDVTLVGGAGNDNYYLDNGTHVIFENAGEGIDTVITNFGVYLQANVENLVLASGGGDDFGVGNELDNRLRGNEGSNLLIGGAGDDIVHGNLGNDILFGQEGADVLAGGDGIDYLVGGNGDDILDGNADADALFGQDGNDILNAGGGFVTDILVGGAGNDSLYGNSRLNEHDLMDGGSGDDSYYVDTGADLTFEAVDGGTDTVYADISNVTNAGVYLYANVENLVLLGTTGFGVGNELNNQLTGSDSGNFLLGGAGNDLINGGAGGDVLFGEAGADTFLFENGTGGDVIGDYEIGEDQMDISAYDFTSFTALQTTFIQNGDVGAINLGNGDFIVLHNVQMDLLTEGDFIL